MLLLIARITAAQPLLPDFSASYAIDLNGIQAGQLKRSLTTQEDGLRVFKSKTRAKGLFALFKPETIVETSLWSLRNDTITPEHYSYVRTGGNKDKWVSLLFDWSKQQLYIDDRKQPWSLALEGPVLDKLVYQLSLMSDLAEGQETFHYRIADGGKIKDYKITHLGEEIVSTPMGRIKAIKLSRERNRPKDRKTTLWCAPGLHYLPVRLEHIEKDGSVFTATIHRLSGIDAEDAFTQTQQER